MKRFVESFSGQQWDRIEALSNAYYWDVYKHPCCTCQGADKIHCCLCLGASLRDMEEWGRKNPEKVAEAACERYNKIFGEGSCRPEDFLVEVE